MMKKLFDAPAVNILHLSAMDEIASLSVIPDGSEEFDDFYVKPGVGMFPGE